MRPLSLTGTLALLTVMPALGQLPVGQAVDLIVKNSDTIELSLQNPGIERGILGVIGITADEVNSLFELCQQDGLIVFVQTDDQELATKMRVRADAAKLLGQRLLIETGSLKHIHLGNNVADRIVVSESTLVKKFRKRKSCVCCDLKELQRLAGQQRIKPVPSGTDDWSHPYHGPDNNPQSDDQLVRGNFRTQFIGYPEIQPDARTDGHCRWTHLQSHGTHRAQSQPECDAQQVAMHQCLQRR